MKYLINKRLSSISYGKVSFLRKLGETFSDNSRWNSRDLIRIHVKPRSFNMSPIINRCHVPVHTFARYIIRNTLAQYWKSTSTIDSRTYSNLASRARIRGIDLFTRVSMIPIISILICMVNNGRTWGNLLSSLFPAVGNRGEDLRYIRRQEDHRRMYVERGLVRGTHR